MYYSISKLLLVLMSVIFNSPEVEWSTSKIDPLAIAMSLIGVMVFIISGVLFFIFRKKN